MYSFDSKDILTVVLEKFHEISSTNKKLPAEGRQCSEWVLNLHAISPKINNSITLFVQDLNFFLLQNGNISMY